MNKLHIATEDSSSVKTAACPPVMPTAHVMAVMRDCGRDLGLGPQVLRTLEALLSCLAPSRNHHMVFASNATLMARCGGLSDRTIRRHILQLIAVDLVQRADSANGKRYSRHDPVAGLTLRFGLDFAKLFARLSQLTALASAARARAQRLAYLRCKLRAACQMILRHQPDNQIAVEAQKAARRNLQIAQFEAILAHLPPLPEQAEIRSKTADLATSGGQNDRHHSSFSKEPIDKESPADLTDLLQHCSEAQGFAPESIDSEEAMIKHAERLAPMIGIAPDLWHQAKQQQSPRDLGALVWLMIQNLSKIAKPGAYFRAVTIGKKAGSFAPWHWLQRQMV